MKKVIILLLISMSASVMAQHKPGQNLFMYQNTAYLVLQPGDLALGIRYDHQFNDFGMYGSIAKGSYHLRDGGYINEHYKAALGYMMHLPNHIGSLTYNTFSWGITYHTYNHKQFYTEAINPVNLRPFSFELGVGGGINHFNTAIRFDVLKHEGCVDVGFAF